MKEKSVWGKIWFFLWKDNSIWSWIVSLLLAFVIVKFIFFPLLSLALGTQLPLVVVESSSMHHSGSLFKSITGIGITSKDGLQAWYNQMGEWYTKVNLSLQDMKNWRFQSGIDKGDIILVRGKKASSLKVGDVIIFDAGQNHPIIHRIIKIDSNGSLTFSTKGDNNNGQLSFENNIPANGIIGKAVLRLPKLGWAKLIFVELFNGFR